MRREGPPPTLINNNRRSSSLFTLFLLIPGSSFPLRLDPGLGRPDVFLLCYKISSPQSLNSALSRWLPEVRAQAAHAHVVLVGCQADLR